jgi:carboxyl-terminal processing protease
MKQTKNASFLLVVILIAVAFLAGHLTGLRLYSNTYTPPLGSQVTQFSGSDFSILNEVYSLLQQNYLKNELPDKADLIEGAAKGLVTALGDKYTVYYTKSEWDELQNSNAGRFEGIGVKLLGGKDYAEVETAIAGSPAAAAGIMAQDLILEVDGVSTKGLPLGQVAEKIRGTEGTMVKVKLLRPKTGKELSFELKRTKITIRAIETESAPHNGLHVKLTRFTETEISEFKSLWDGVVAKAQADKASYLVLDLRNNTGGWVNAANYVLEDFFPQGTLVLREVDKDGNEQQIKTTRAGRLQDMKLVVLVNSGSASASEIVAGALQDTGRAKLVGQPTLGKGVEQVIQRTSDGGSLFIVFKKWLTPSGKNLSESNALKPDYDIELTEADISARRDPQLDKALEIVR